jgi:hypothetical protein
MYPRLEFTMLSYFDLSMLIAAFFSDEPKRAGGILTTSPRVEIENTSKSLTIFNL